MPSCKVVLHCITPYFDKHAHWSWDLLLSSFPPLLGTYLGSHIPSSGDYNLVYILHLVVLRDHTTGCDAYSFYDRCGIFNVCTNFGCVLYTQWGTRHKLCLQHNYQKVLTFTLRGTQKNFTALLHQGIEPSVFGLEVLHSTTELHPPYDGIHCKSLNACHRWLYSTHHIHNTITLAIHGGVHACHKVHVYIVKLLREKKRNI